MTCISGVIPNQIKTSKISWSATQKNVVIGYAIGGLTSSSTTLEQAISASGLTIGDACPTDSLCLLNTIDVESLYGQADTVTSLNATYTGFDYFGSPNQTSGGSSIDDGINLSYAYSSAMNQDQTNTTYSDPDVPLLVYWWANPANIGAFNNSSIAQGALVNVLKPQVVKRVSFFYNIPSGFPDTTITSLEAQVGKTNDALWDNGTPDQWLVTGCDAQCVGLPQQMKIDITFMYKEEKWLSWALYTDPFTGQRPNPCHKNINDPNQTTATTGSNGARGFQVYGQISFLSIFGFQ